MEADQLLLALSERQHGYVLRSDARDFGMTRSALAHRIRRGDWAPEGRHLLRRPGAPISKASPLMRAVLSGGPGSFISGPSAAAWWGVPGFFTSPIDLSRPRGLAGVAAEFADVVHEVLDLSTNQVAVLDGIPIVRPERLAFELHAMLSPRRAARAVENMWAMNLLSGRSLRAVFDELAGRGRDGTVASREFLDGHPNDWTPPATGLEGRLRHQLALGDLGEWRRQVDVGGEAGWTGRVDFKHATLPVIIEVQSERYHAALLDVAADAIRKAKLEADGFIVVEVWDYEVWHQMDVVLRRVRQALDEACRPHGHVY